MEYNSMEIIQYEIRDDSTIHHAGAPGIQYGGLLGISQFMVIC